MTPDEARAVVHAALDEIAPDVDAAQLDPGSSLRELAEMDSLDFLSYVGALCDALGQDIPESDYRALDTVDASIAYLVERSGPG